MIPARIYAKSTIVMPMLDNLWKKNWCVQSKNINEVAIDSFKLSRSRSRKSFDQHRLRCQSPSSLNRSRDEVKQI